MRKIALDVGDVRIGIATSDPMSIIAGGYETFVRTKDLSRDMEHISRIIKEKECDTIVIGLPLNMDGTSGKRADMAREFAKKLEEYVNMPIVFQDERLSTVSAEKSL